MTVTPKATDRPFSLPRALDLLFEKTGGVDEWERAKVKAQDELELKLIAARERRDAQPSLPGMILIGMVLGLLAWAWIE